MAAINSGRRPEDKHQHQYHVMGLKRVCRLRRRKTKKINKPGVRKLLNNVSLDCN